MASAANRITYSVWPPTHGERHAATPALHRRAGLSSVAICGHPHTGSGTQPPQLSTGVQGCLLSPSVATHTRGAARSHPSSPQARRVVFCRHLWPPTHGERHAATPALHRRAGLSSVAICGHPHTGSGTQPPQLSTGVQGCLLSPSVATHTRGAARSHPSSPQARRVVFCRHLVSAVSPPIPLLTPVVEDGHEAQAARGGDRWLLCDGTDTLLRLYRRTRQPCKHRQNNYKSQYTMQTAYATQQYCTHYHHNSLYDYSE